MDGDIGFRSIDKEAGSHDGRLYSIVAGFGV